MINVTTRSRWQIENMPLPGPSAVVRMADSADQLANILDKQNVVCQLDLIFNDASQPFGIVAPPTIEHARAILQFFLAQLKNGTPHLVLQCQAGIGRSHGAAAALAKVHGDDNRSVLARGTYNRWLYRLILNAAGLTPEPEPQVSIAVRVKYDPEKLYAFLLSVRRQRYDNWQIVAVTDGPNQPAVDLVNTLRDPRIGIIQTAEPRGRWGHPYRQLGIDACRGEFIGLSNDDNYLTPGFMEQMVFAAENADLVLCRFLHNYKSWGVAVEGTDLSAWLARASLIRQTPWTGVEFDSDAKYLELLRSKAGTRIAVIERPLLVHN